MAVFTNCESAELELNGRKITGKPHKDPDSNALLWDVDYEEGELTVSSTESEDLVFTNVYEEPKQPEEPGEPEPEDPKDPGSNNGPDKPSQPQTIGKTNDPMSMVVMGILGLMAVAGVALAVTTLLRRRKTN